MAELFTFSSLWTLLMLIMLQAVLGFDNLLYISLESKKAPEKDQKRVRKLGILIAIVLRIVLLFIIMAIIEKVQSVLFSINVGDIISVESHGEMVKIHSVIDSHFNIHSLIVLVGGVFIIYTAIKEIWHMISNNDFENNEQKTERKSKTANAVIVSIVIMNLVFSFDSILAAIGLTSEIGNYNVEMVIMSIAIISSGLLMVLLADRVSEFLNKNRMYEVLGLFILFIVGIMLLTEGGHLAKINILGHPIERMNNTTFYFIIIILVLIDIVQSRYQKKIIRQEQKEQNS